MRKSFITLTTSAVLLLSSLPSNAAECKPVELLLPLGSNSTAYVKKAVKLALLDEEWKFNSETDGTVTATYGKEDSEQLTVLIGFDSKKVLISYLKSESRYGSDEETCDAPNTPEAFKSAIRRRMYVRWTSRLSDYILINLQRVQILLN
jgi:hypothetical protein